MSITNPYLSCQTCDLLSVVLQVRSVRDRVEDGGGVRERVPLQHLHLGSVESARGLRRRGVSVASVAVGAVRRRGGLLPTDLSRRVAVVGSAAYLEHKSSMAFYVEHCQKCVHALPAYFLNLFGYLCLLLYFRFFVLFMCKGGRYIVVCGGGKGRCLTWCLFW